MDALADSKFGTLSTDTIVAILAHVDPDEAFFVALACKGFYETLKEMPRYRTRKSGSCAGARFLTPNVALVANRSRFNWIRRLGLRETERSPAMVPRWIRLGMMDEDTMCAMIPSATLELLDYACLHGCPMDHRSFKVAAKYGRVDVIEWLVEKGCPTERRGVIAVCYHAARFGRLEVLQWADETLGIHWSIQEACLDIAKGYNHWEFRGAARPSVATVRVIRWLNRLQWRKG